jgi:hypothetical protein
VTPDSIVALIGMVMALILVTASGELRKLRLSAQLWMAAAWVVIILLAAGLFVGFRR